jgi:trans-aconitate methyltransferase
VNTTATPTLARRRSAVGVGCGLGSSSVLIAAAYPPTTVVGSDYHPAPANRSVARWDSVT